MPWSESTTLSLREDFVKLAIRPGVNRRELCLRFGISRRIGYKWLKRYAEEGVGGLNDRSRRTRRSLARTGTAIEPPVPRTA